MLESTPTVNALASSKGLLLIVGRSMPDSNPTVVNSR